MVVVVVGERLNWKLGSSHTHFIYYHCCINNAVWLHGRTNVIILFHQSQSSVSHCRNALLRIQYLLNIFIGINARTYIDYVPPVSFTFPHSTRKNCKNGINNRREFHGLPLSSSDIPMNCFFLLCRILMEFWILHFWCYHWRQIVVVTTDTQWFGLPFIMITNNVHYLNAIIL